MTAVRVLVLPVVLALASLSACTVEHDYSSPGYDPYTRSSYSPTPHTYEVPGPPPPGYYYYYDGD